jgi:hypothetical protein
VRRTRLYCWEIAGERGGEGVRVLPGSDDRSFLGAGSEAGGERSR